MPPRPTRQSQPQKSTRGKSQKGTNFSSFRFAFVPFVYLPRSSERHAVIEKDVPVFRRVGIGPTVVTNAIAGVEQTALGQRYRNSGGKVTIVIFSAIPVRHNADLRMNRLLVSQDRSCPMCAHTRKSRRILIRHHIGTSRNARTVVARFYLLAEVSVKKPPGVVAGSLVQWRMEKGSSGDGKSFIVVLEKLPFDIRFDVAAGGTAAAIRNRIGIVKHWKIHADFDVPRCADHKAWI